MKRLHAIMSWYRVGPLAPLAWIVASIAILPWDNLMRSYIEEQGTARCPWKPVCHLQVTTILRSEIPKRCLILDMAESPGKMIALATVLTILPMIAVALRFYARRIKGTDFAWDDYLILPALVRLETHEVCCKDCLDRGTDDFLSQAFTVATAVCMLVGEYPVHPRATLHFLRRRQAVYLGILDGIAPSVQTDGLSSIADWESFWGYL